MEGPEHGGPGAWQAGATCKLLNPAPLSFATIRNISTRFFFPSPLSDVAAGDEKLDSYPALSCRSNSRFSSRLSACVSPHFFKVANTGLSDIPSSVSSYSTRGGTSA